MPNFMLVILLAAAAEIGAEETPGLSKGPANPAEIGTRCAVMAGREDRAYLNCPEPAAIQPRGDPASIQRRVIEQQQDSRIQSRPANTPTPGR